MNRSRRLMMLGVAIVLQLIVLTGMVVKASAPLWSGTEIRVKTVPYDPRSMFRGNYARLDYEISALPADELGATERLRKGEVVYVSLEENQNSIYEFESAALERPEHGVYLRGRLANNHPPYRVKYGIEAFFAPKENALRLQNDLRSGGIAILMVTDSGAVALKDVVPDTG